MSVYRITRRCRLKNRRPGLATWRVLGNNRIRTSGGHVTAIINRPSPRGAQKKGNKKLIREFFKILYKKFGFKNSGLTLKFRSLVGIGSSGVMIGSLCLNMVQIAPEGSELITLGSICFQSNSKLRNRIQDFMIKFEFHDFSLLGVKCCVFRAETSLFLVITRYHGGVKRPY